jgi:hypothetical protein
MKKLSAKELSLGYVQMKETSDKHSPIVVRTTLWREHGVYHIRSHAFGGPGRLGWHRAKTYTLAQDIYKDHIRAFH